MNFCIIVSIRIEFGWPNYNINKRNKLHVVFCFEGIASKVCKLPAECSIHTECEEPKYICFHCDLVFCKNCFGLHMDKNDDHRVLDASQFCIIHRNHKGNTVYIKMWYISVSSTYFNFICLWWIYIWYDFFVNHMQSFILKVIICWCFNIMYCQTQ